MASGACLSCFIVCFERDLCLLFIDDMTNHFLTPIVSTIHNYLWYLYSAIPLLAAACKCVE